MLNVSVEVELIGHLDSRYQILLRLDDPGEGQGYL